MSDFDYNVYDTKPPKSSTKKILWWVLGLLAAFIIFTCADSLYRTVRLEGVANRDVVREQEPEWVKALPDGRSGGGWWCLDFAGDCGSVDHTYLTDRPIDEADLMRISNAAGWNLEIEERCRKGTPEDSGLMSLCNARGIVEDMEIKITVRDGPDNGSYVTVRVEDIGQQPGNRIGER